MFDKKKQIYKYRLFIPVTSYGADVFEALQAAFDCVASLEEITDKSVEVDFEVVGTVNDVHVMTEDDEELTN